MPTFYQLPADQRAGPVFSVTINGAHLAYEKCLYNNTMTPLLLLADWLEINVKQYRRSKGDLCNAIYARITWTTEEEALERWPVLVPLKATPNKKKDLQVALAGFNTLLGDIMDETPEFYAHANNIWLDLRGKSSAIFDEERRLEEEKKAPPAWWNLESSTPLPKPCWKVTLETDEQDHDGYCSGTEEDDIYVKQTNTTTHYVPLKNEDGADWDFSKESWQGDPSGCSGGCGCCGTYDKVRFKSVEKVE